MNRPLGNIEKASLSGTALAPSLEQRRLRAYILLICADLLIIHGGFLLAGWLYTGLFPENRSLMQAQLLLPIFYTIALYNGTYSAIVLTNMQAAVRKLFTAAVLSAALLNFVAFYTKSTTNFSRVTFTLGLILSFLGMAALRRIAIELVRIVWRGKVQNRLIIDDGGPRFELEGAQRVSAQEAAIDPRRQDPYMLDRLGQFLLNQDKVVVCCLNDRRAQWAAVLKAAGVRGEIVSEPAHEIGAIGIEQYDMQGRTTLVVSTGPLGLRQRATKRLLDIFLSFGGLVVLSPLFLTVALLIKLEDRGPVFFVQRRFGRGNRFFRMLKFRSMREDRLDADGQVSTARDDDRITRIGKFIRATSIDELPQLLNVLRGDMSLVGPRPHALGSHAGEKLFWEVDGTYWHRHALKPGLTGLAQIRGYRGNTEREEDLTDRLQSDLEYIAGWSIGRDIGILFRTLSVLRHDRAY